VGSPRAGCKAAASFGFRNILRESRRPADTLRTRMLGRFSAYTTTAMIALAAAFPSSSRIVFITAPNAPSTPSTSLWVPSIDAVKLPLVMPSHSLTICGLAFETEKSSFRSGDPNGNPATVPSACPVDRREQPGRFRRALCPVERFVRRP